MSAPEVTVVMPTWNRPQLLRFSVESVLAQTVAFDELILADDGSDAATRAVLEEFAARPRVRVLWRQHQGNPGAVRNAAIREASGRYIAFADSDDLWHPEKLGRQLTALRENPQCRWCYSAARLIDGQGEPIVLEPNTMRLFRGGNLLEKLAQLETDVPLPSVLAERGLLLEAGLFEESMGCYEDYDLWTRLAVLSEACVIPDVLVAIRIHDAHFSRGDSNASLSGREMFLGRALRLVQSPEARRNVLKLRTITRARLWATRARRLWAVGST
jgi:glycosyltransferase involved in cell wall biosynthesis